MIWLTLTYTSGGFSMTDREIVLAALIRYPYFNLNTAPPDRPGCPDYAGQGPDGMPADRAKAATKHPIA